MLTDISASGLTAADRIEIKRMLDVLVTKPIREMAEVLTMQTDAALTVSLSPLHTSRWSREACVPGQWMDGRDVVAAFGPTGRFTRLEIDGQVCSVPRDPTRRGPLFGCLLDYIGDTITDEYPLFGHIQQRLTAV